VVDPENDAGAAAMAELFHSIGFEIADEHSYNRLVEYVEASGLRSQVERGEALIHGRCLKLGDGVEVWSVLFERGAEFYYADCRPAFRSRYVHTIAPWELLEFDEDGEAIVRGTLGAGLEVVFELQNLTETSQKLFREPQLKVGLGAIAYWIEERAEKGSQTASRFDLAERLPDYAANACESDYLITGRVLAMRDLRNPVTGAPLVWMFVDAGVIRVEVIASSLVIAGRVNIGSNIAAGVWLQGHVLAEAEVSARFEGVDPDHRTGDFWATLRRGN
jgi:hypothetical protein